EQLARQGGGRVELAETLAARARLARRRAETAQADALARQAAELYSAIGAAPAPQLPAPGGAAPRPVPAGLSPRELEVVRLVAQGRTNREIAATLVISEKTAINHLTHVFEKLCLALHSGRADRDEREHGGGRCLNRAAV